MAKGLTAVPRKLAFFWQQKKARKENCRCFDAADPRPRGCTPLGTPKRKSEDSAAKRTQYYCPFLTPPNLPPLLSRVFPRTPATINFPFDCRGRACPARSLASASGFALCPLVCYIVGRGLDPSATFRSTAVNGSSVGEGFIPPGHFPPPQTSAAARGLAALQPPLKNPCAGENSAPTAGRRGRRPLQSLP